MTDNIMEPGFYNMDCMEAMKKFPDKFFDLAICDPPYGINATKFGFGEGQATHNKPSPQRTIERGRLNAGAGKLKDRTLNKAKIAWDSAPPSEEYFKELFRVSQNQIIWGGITLTFQRHGVWSYGTSNSLGRTSPL